MRHGLRVPGSRRFSPGGLVRSVLARRNSIEAPIGAGWESERRAIRETRRKVPLLLTDAAALQILLGVRAARRLGGAMAEAGVFMGGSARLICETKGPAPLYLFDVFETLQGIAAPSPAGQAAAVRRHFGAVHGAEAAVARLLAPYPNVHMRPGLFPASAAGMPETRFSFVHLDLDLPQGMHDALSWFHPRLLPGALLIGDDYWDPRVREVFAAFFADRPDTFIELPWGQVMVVRQGKDISLPAGRVEGEIAA